MLLDNNLKTKKRIDVASRVPRGPHDDEQRHAQRDRENPESYTASFPAQYRQFNTVAILLSAYMINPFVPPPPPVTPVLGEESIISPIPGIERPERFRRVSEATRRILYVFRRTSRRAMSITPHV